MTPTELVAGPPAAAGVGLGALLLFVRLLHAPAAQRPGGARMLGALAGTSAVAASLYLCPNAACLLSSCESQSHKITDYQTMVNVNARHGDPRLCVRPRGSERQSRAFPGLLFTHCVA